MTDHIYGIPGVDYPADGLDIFDRLEQAGAMTPRASVIAYLLRRTDPDTGVVLATYREIQDYTGAAAGTVASVMKALQNSGDLKRIRNGVWQFDIRKPDDDKVAYVFVRRA